jgi:hypothetical protein
MVHDLSTKQKQLEYWESTVCVHGHKDLSDTGSLFQNWPEFTKSITHKEVLVRWRGTVPQEFMWVADKYSGRPLKPLKDVVEEATVRFRESIDEYFHLQRPRNENDADASPLPSGGSLRPSPSQICSVAQYPSLNSNHSTADKHGRKMSVRGFAWGHLPSFNLNITP